MKNEGEGAASFCIRTAGGGAVKLAMQELWVSGQICPVGARLVVRHVFESRETKPLEAVYAFGLPRDAALRQFRIEGPGFQAHSELQPVEQARKKYEDGIEAGHLAALAQTYRDGRVNLALGNLRTGERMVVFLEILAGIESQDTGFRFRFPFTLPPTYHPEARYSESEPGVGEMELPESQFGDLLLPPFHRNARNLHRVGFDLDVRVPGLIEVASPSHTLKVRRIDPEVTWISLGCEGDLPNRDLVVDVTLPPEPVVLTARDSAGATQIAARVPSTVIGRGTPVAKRLVFLLDCSGSMEGEPLAQAKRAIEACLGTLRKEDLFGLVAFSTTAQAMSPHLLEATGANREEAARFLEGIQAVGGTEMLSGFLKAAGVLAEKGGEIFLFTDGQVSEADTLIAQARAQSIRLHALGIGAAAQDRFLEQWARATGGISRCATTGERVDLAAVNLFISCTTPVADGFSAGVLTTTGARVPVEPEAHRLLYAGIPALIFAEIAEGDGAALELTWSQPVEGRREIPLPAEAGDRDWAQTLRLLRGARLLTDAEARVGAGAAGSDTARKRGQQWMTRLSREYGLAGPTMALVAVVERAGDKPGEPPLTRVVPVGLPGDMEAGAYFSTKPRANKVVCSMPVPNLAARGRVSGARSRSCFPELREESARQKRWRILEDLEGTSNPDDIPAYLFRIFRMVDADGGMPGLNEEDRVAKSLVALLILVESGLTSWERGVFYVPIHRLAEYLEEPDRRRIWEGSGCRSFVEALLKDIRGNVERSSQHLHLAGRAIQDEVYTLAQLEADLGAIGVKKPGA